MSFARCNLKMLITSEVTQYTGYALLSYDLIMILRDQFKCYKELFARVFDSSGISQKAAEITLCIKQNLFREIFMGAESRKRADYSQMLTHTTIGIILGDFTGR